MRELSLERTLPSAVLKEAVMGHTMEATSDSMPASVPARDLGRVYRDHVSYVWRSLKHLGVQDADIEDVAHDVFLVVARKLDGFEERSSLKTWIYGICLRTAADYRGRAFRRREVTVDELPEPVQRSAVPEQERELSSKRQRNRLLELLDGLSQEQREVFVLYEVEELTMREVAEVLACPLQTAYSRLHAARRNMRDALSAGQVQP
jgi:RNA polymerase sigma-70 factor, ECF subfamily